MFFKREKSLELKIAYIISRIFEPFLWLFILGILIVSSSHFGSYNRVAWAAGLGVFLGVLPIMTFWFGLKKGKIEDIDLSRREQRTPYILIIIFYWLLGLILTWAFSGPKLIFAIVAIALIIALVVLIINLYWKISNHALAITVVSLYINQLYDWQHVWFFVFVPVVAWARWVQKKHSAAQLAGGVGLGIVAWLLLVNFGY